MDLETADLPPSLVLPDESRYPHEPDDDPMWNDSALMAWVDPKAKLAGFFRFGYQPVRGVANYQCGISSFDGLRFRNTFPEIKLAGNERQPFGYWLNGFLQVSFGKRENRWTGSNDDCKFDLCMKEYIPLIDYLAVTQSSDDAQTRRELSNHYDTAGRVVGSVELGGKTHNVDCLGYGDRSWGPRHWGMSTHRWFVGTFGDDFCFSMVTATAPPAMQVHAGYVLKDGKIDRVYQLDALVWNEVDGVTQRGGRLAVLTEGGQRYEISYAAHDCVLLEADEHLGADALCTIRCGDRVGMGILECSYNARGGREYPPVVIGAATENGISRRAHPLLLEV